MAADLLQPRHAIHYIHSQAEAVNVVVDGEFQRRIDVALLLVSAHMNVVVIRAPISQPMNELRISVEIEDDRLVDREKGIEIAVGQSMRMLAGRLQFEEIDHVDEANLKIAGIPFAAER